MLSTVQTKPQAPFVYHERGEGFVEEWETIDVMQFRLVYEGSLKSSGNSVKHVGEKHAIRTQFHEQLSNLYDNHEVLKSLRYYVESDVEKARRYRSLGVTMAADGASITETLRGGSFARMAFGSCR